jgi:hypothetical protein
MKDSEPRRSIRKRLADELEKLRARERKEQEIRERFRKKSGRECFIIWFGDERCLVLEQIQKKRQKSDQELLAAGWLPNPSGRGFYRADN